MFVIDVVRFPHRSEDCFYMDMRGEGVHRMGTNPCASESPRPELSHAQGFISKSLTVASEYSTENPSFSEIRIFSPKFTSFSCMKMCTQLRDYDNLFVSFKTFYKYLPLCCCFSQTFRSNSATSLFETLCVGKFRPHAQGFGF